MKLRGKNDGGDEEELERREWEEGWQIWSEHSVYKYEILKLKNEIK